MKALFLDAYFEPEQIAFTHLENDLLDGLVKAGHTVEVICPTPTRGVSKEVAEKYKRIKSENLYGGNVHITRFLAPQEGKNPITRALRYFWCNLRTHQIGEGQKDIDVVFANSTPPTQGWIAGKVARRLSVPFVYSLQDIFPDSLVNAEMTKEGSFLWKIGKVIEKETYKSATKIITISNGFKRNLIEKGVENNKIVVIPNWIDTSKVYNVPKTENRIIKKFGLDPNSFYVCYSGNIGHSQNFELLVEVAKEIQERKKDIVFIIIGEGVAKVDLINAIQRNSVDNIKVFPFQSYKDIAHVFSLGDVGLVISKPGIGGSSVPSKTWSIMAAGRPVLASFDRGGELEEIIKEGGCGLFVNAGNKEDLVNTIMNMSSERSILHEMGAKGREYVYEKMSRNKCVEGYIIALETICDI